MKCVQIIKLANLHQTHVILNCHVIETSPHILKIVHIIKKWMIDFEMSIFSFQFCQLEKKKWCFKSILVKKIKGVDSPQVDWQLVVPLVGFYVKRTKGNMETTAKIKIKNPFNDKVMLNYVLSLFYFSICFIENMVLGIIRKIKKIFLRAPIC